MTIAFDHHPSFTHFANLNYLDSTTGACAEIIYQFLTYCKIKITPQIAHNLYIGVSSDTGAFRQSNTTAQSMRIGAELIEKGAHHAEINTALFLSNTLEYTRLLTASLNTLQTFHNNEIAIMYVSKEMLSMLDSEKESPQRPDFVGKRSNSGKSELQTPFVSNKRYVAYCDVETEGFANHVRNIVGVKISFFLREKTKEDGTSFIKISARSNHDKYDVSKPCEHWSGGGHLRAAGGKIPHNNMQKAIEEITKKTISFIEESDNSPPPKECPQSGRGVL